jgi:hypothetical protein
MDMHPRVFSKDDCQVVMKKVRVGSWKQTAIDEQTAVCSSCAPFYS